MTQGPQTHNERIIAEFRQHNGQVGGNFAGAPLLLCTPSAPAADNRASTR